MVNQRNIAVDVGNSVIKSAEFSGNELLSKSIWKDLESLAANYRGQDVRWIFSSVSEAEERIETLFRKWEYHILRPSTRIPIVLDYKTPETLGMDRIAAAIGAGTLYPDKCSLIIDAGSCITYDLVEKDIFRGGIIAPGLKMRMKAMNHFTRRLPDISAEWEHISVEDPGKSTRECMRIGAFNGIIHEIHGYIDHYLKEFPDLCVILTGGDAIHFESSIKAPIFADLNLVLIGLNRILNYNK